MRQLARYAARLAAAVLVVAIMIGPIVAVAAIAGNPFPADLFSRIGGRNVNDATILKLLSLCFYVCWAWFCLPALRQLLSARHAPLRASPTTRRPGAAATPAAAAPRAGVGDPTRGPRSALARLARFAVSSAAVVTSLASVSGVAYAGPTVRPAVVATVGPAPTAPAALKASTPASTSATAVEAQHRDTPYAIASRYFSDDQVDTARDEILSLNLGRPLPDGSTYRGGGFPAGWNVIVPAAAATVAVTATVAPDSAAPLGHVVVDDESYWSITEDYLPSELGREPSPAEALARTEAAIAFNAPLLGYDDPRMLHTGDVVYVDAVTLGLTASPVTDESASGGHVVVDDESYWSITEDYLPSELGREPTGTEVLDRTKAAIAYNAPLLGDDDPRMLHTGDVVYVDAVTLGLVAPPAPPVPASGEPASSVETTPIPTDAASPAAPSPPPATTRSLTTAAADTEVDDDTVVPTTAATVSPTTTATTWPPPVVTATPRAATEVSAVEQEDMLSSRWLFGGVAVTSLGLVGAWQTVKQMRRRRRRWLGHAATHDVGTEPTVRERGAQLDVAMLGQFVAGDRLASRGACAVVLGEHPEIRFRVPPPAPPTGWELADGAWRRNESEPMTSAPVLSPALVTIGHGTDDDTVSEVVLDLLSAGTVSVTGDRVAVERLMCSMLWELASAPLGEQIELHVVGLACVAARHAVNAGRQVSMDEAIATARTPVPVASQVFLVDPFAADDTAVGSLRELVEACAPGSGRAVVVAGPCEHPVEEISVPSEHRAMWDDLTLVPPQLPESVDVELGRMLDAIEVGRRPVSSVGAVLTPDPVAEAVALRSTLTAVVDGGGDGSFTAGDDDTVHEEIRGGATSVVEGDLEDEDCVVVDDPIEGPTVVLSVCGREVAVRGHPVPQAAAVLFVLAAAGRPMGSSDLSELTGYAAKSLSTVFTASHQLVDRKQGMLRLVDGVWTDHGWATRCVTHLADAMRIDAQSADTRRWMVAALDALHGLEQAPFAVLPTGKGVRAWRWVDDFPEAVPARTAAETEVAEAALAFSELWLAAPETHLVVHAEQMVAELCRLAATVPFAHVRRQLRESVWVSGAECLLLAAGRAAGDDEMLMGRVHQTGRALVGRQQLVASTALADELGL